MPAINSDNTHKMIVFQLRIWLSINPEKEGSVLPRGGDVQDSSAARSPGNTMEKETFDFPQ